MNIYALPNHYYDLVNLDTNSIGDVTFSTLDEYLYKFPDQKRLLTGYIKRMDTSVDISELHDLFCDFGIVSYFSSETHQERLETDRVYKLITERYVKNPIVWTSSTQRIQSHYFDSKYLKIGKYQKIARKNAHQYFNMQSTNNVINYSKVRTTNNIDKHNKYFTDRYILEGVLKGFVQKNIDSEYVVVVYDQVIEIYIPHKHASIQIEFTKWDSKVFLIWGYGTKARKKSESFNEIFTILNDERSLLKFVQDFRGLDNGFIDKYADRLAKIKSEHKHTINLMVGNIKYTIRELFKEESCTYFTPEINTYIIHHGSPERMHVTKSGNILRIHRHINYGSPDEIRYCSYSISDKDFTKVALTLFNLGVINVSLGKTIDDNFDYGLLANGQMKNFALSFMKVPTTEASKMFDDYERFGAHLRGEIEKNPNPTDTRVFKDYSVIPENTFFELVSYKTDKVRHKSEKGKKQNVKYNTIKMFLDEYKKDIEFFS